MTPAELKTIREYLGLPVSWIARQSGVQERTVRYWESGRTLVPEDVANLMNQLSEIMTFEIERIYSNIALSPTKRTYVDLVRRTSEENYWNQNEKANQFKLPLSFQTNILIYVKKRLQNDGIEAHISYDK